ncbi:MAG: hypothetical protein OSB07_04075 [Dehalococcoidia bacterium]|nr:hypothetical protein [Dehalococcoidia bacterium]
MRIELTNGNKWLTRFGMTIISPVLIAMGAVVVIALTTPDLQAVSVVSAAIALLMVSTMVTRETPAMQNSD